LGLAVGAFLLRQAHWETERRRQEAEQHYQLARDAVDRFFIRISEEQLIKEPRMERLRKDLLEAAREFYQKLADQRQADPGSLADLAHAYNRLAEIHNFLGSMTETVAATEKAVSIYSKLASQRPGELRNWSLLAHTFTVLGTHLLRAGESARAEHALRQALEILEPLTAEHSDATDPATADLQAALALTEANLGILLMRIGRPEQAEAFVQQSVSRYSRLVSAHPDVPIYQHGLAESYADLGESYCGAMPGEEKETAVRNALALWERLVADHPADLYFNRSLSSAHFYVGDFCSRAERWQDAAAAYRRALEIEESLAVKFPGTPVLSVQVAFRLAELGFALAEAGQLGKGETLLRRSVEMADGFPREIRANFTWDNLLADIARKLGRVLQRRGDDRSAGAWFDRAEAKARALLDRDPRRADVRYVLRRVHLDRAEGLARRGRHAEALAALDRAHDLDDEHTRDATRLARAATLAAAGDHAGAQMEARIAACTESIPPGPLAYRLTRVHATCARAAEADARLDPVTRAALVERLGTESLSWLDRARRAGYLRHPERIVWMSRDPELDPLRSRPDFQLLMQDLAFPADPFVR
jgi:tetratricopeptide (TPR) repeat protein